MLAVLNGQAPDRIPWAPRLEIWYRAHQRRDTLPDEFKNCSLREIYRSLGMCYQARDLVRRRIYRTELSGVEVRENRIGYNIQREYITPLGKVSTLHRSSAELERDGIEALEVEHMIKSVDDYPVVEYIIQHTDLFPTYDDYLDYEREVGDEGIIITYIGQDPMSWLILELIGSAQAYYHLADYPHEVSHLLAVLDEHCRERQKLALESPARLIMHGQHFDTQLTPVPLFKKYLLPYYQPFAEQMQARGKVLACHADADTTKILELVKQAGFKLLDCFLTAPMVKMTLAEARGILGRGVIIWGGIPSTILSEHTPMDEFERYMDDLFRIIAPGEAFILGVADNVMPDSDLERVRKISAMILERGAYPLPTT